MKVNSFFGAMMLVFIISGCAARMADPVIAQQTGDSNMTCQALEKELILIQQTRKNSGSSTSKTATNVSVGISGFIVPFLFIDLNQVEKIETNAYKKRHNHLMIIAYDKQCDIKGLVIPELES